jgi:hypothetical protein
MGLQQLAGPYAVPVAIVVGFAAITTSLFLYLFGRPQLPKTAPQLASNQLPVLGAWSFFSKRCEFHIRNGDPKGTYRTRVSKLMGLRHILRDSHTWKRVD